MRSRKIAIAAIAAASLLLPLAACSSSKDSSDSSGPVTIRFSWWGADARAKLQQQVIDGFEAKHPNIKIEAETSNYDDYITKLSTSAAANDLPDVLTVIDPFMYDYMEAGSFLDLTTVKDQLDLSKFPQDSFTDVSGKDGEKYGVSLGVSGHGIIINPDVFKAYGVPLPDDKTWSWEDFEKTALAVSKASGGKAVGFNLELTEQMANLWLRQNNERFGEGPDGKPAVDFNAATMASWFTFQKKLIDEGATNRPDQAQENFAAGNAPDQSLIAHDKAAMAMTSMNQLKQFETAAGHELTPVLWPGETQAKNPGGWTKQGTYVSISAATKHKEAAAMFVDYLVNNGDAAKIMGLDRGVPANTELAANLQQSLQGPDLRFAQWVKKSQAANKQPYYRVNTGVATTLTQSYARANESTIFGKASPEAAAKSLYDELNAAAAK
jgi:multiple sugar transport system substrate-binding protein